MQVKHDMKKVKGGFLQNEDKKHKKNRENLLFLSKSEKPKKNFKKQLTNLFGYDIIGSLHQAKVIKQ